MDEQDAKKRPFYKRRSVVVTAAVLAVAAVTVVTDLPTSTSVASQLSSDKAVMQQVNSDVAPCAFAASESFTLYADEQGHSLSKSDRGRIPGLLNDDQDACSFTSEQIYDLASDLDIPNSSSGKPLGQMAGTVTLWATSDALSAIELIQTLSNDPGNGSALNQLNKEEALLASDRAKAEAELRSADQVLGTDLPALSLPALPDPHTG
jgi:hypothetical protein